MDCGPRDTIVGHATERSIFSYIHDMYIVLFCTLYIVLFQRVRTQPTTLQMRWKRYGHGMKSPFESIDSDLKVPIGTV